MKYRIKIITYGDGRTEYLPQFKSFFGWSSLTELYLDEDELSYSDVSCSNLESALEKIEEHRKEALRCKEIKVEYKYL